MSVQVFYIGRLGNNLFQYALGRLIAEHHGLALECAPMRFEDFFPAGTKPADWGPPEILATLARDYGVGLPSTLQELGPAIFQSDLRVTGRRHDTPVDPHAVVLGRDWGGQAIDLPAILADARPRQIRLAGFFQRYEYYAAHRERLLRWFRCRTTGTVAGARRRDVLVNIRRGSDFDGLNWTLPLSYYEQTLDGMADLGRVHVVGTGIDEHTRSRLARFDPVYHSGTAAENFLLYRQFQRIVLANSTFAWWAAYLSDAREIHGPRSADGSIYAFTGFRDVDLHMRDARYREVPTQGNAVVHRCLDARTGKLRVARQDGQAQELPVHGVNRRLLDWLLDRTRVPDLAELHAAWADHVTPESLSQLSGSGLVSMALRL